jgi:predicted nucleic acid-binding protein
MGVILDSSAVIAGERKGRTAAELLATLRATIGPGPIAISTVSVIELEHGIWRANDNAVFARRKRFFDDLFDVVPAYPLTFEIARLAARIDAEAKAKGMAIQFQDLVIGVTALEFGYAVATLNVRHFAMIPELKVLALK